MKKLLTMTIIALLLAFSLNAADKIKVLIIDGVNNHNWKATTAANKATLLSTGKFTVDVSSSPANKKIAVIIRKIKDRVFIVMV